jgi:predicted phage terminase large subunit-like protein
MDGLHKPVVWSPSIIQAEELRLSLRKFTRAAWKQFDSAKLVWGWAQDALCDHLSYVSMGDIRFLLINIAPRTSKSSLLSVSYPAWDWLHHPERQFLTGSYSLQLATRDAVKSRRLIQSPWYQSLWGRRFELLADQQNKRDFANNMLGRRIVTATEATTTGEGGNRIILDDPHNAKEAESEAIREGTCEWMDNAVSNRLNDADTDGWVVCGQRTHEADLFGHILDRYNMDEIVHLVLPNEFDSSRRCTTFLPARKGQPRTRIFRDPRKKDGELLNPQRFSADATARQKRIMREKYELQYNQNADAAAGHIMPKRLWNQWSETVEWPECEYVFDVYDTAFGEKEENDFSARTTWGVFLHRVPKTIDRANDPLGVEVKTRKARVSTLGETELRRCIILLGAWRDKIGYPGLKTEAIRQYKKIRPRYTLIENKASGISLAQDLGRSGVQGIRKISYAHGGRVKLDKLERAKLASPVLFDGLVYHPNRVWAHEVIRECANFPNGANDDWVDTVSMAWQWLRRLGDVKLYEDEAEDGSVRIFKKKRRGYG